MWRGIFSFLYRVSSVSRFIAERRARPGWRVLGERKEVRYPDPVPFVSALPLPEGLSCPWNLPGCRCGLCLHGLPPPDPFKSRLIDPDAPRAYWL